MEEEASVWEDRIRIQTQFDILKIWLEYRLDAVGNVLAGVTENNWLRSS